MSIQVHRASIVKIQKAAEQFVALRGMTVEDLKNRTRKRFISWQRQEFMHEMRKYFSMPVIGGFFLMDHSTVAYATKAHEKRIKEGIKIKIKLKPPKVSAIKAFQKIRPKYNDRLITWL